MELTEAEEAECEAERIEDGHRIAADAPELKAAATETFKRLFDFYNLCGTMFLIGDGAGDVV